MPFLEPPAVDDVADQIERLAIDVVEEVDQQIGIAAAGAEVDVADPHGAIAAALADDAFRSEEHTSELQSLMRISYAVFCLKKKTKNNKHETYNTINTITLLILTI